MNAVNTIPPHEVMAAVARREPTGPDRRATHDVRAAVAAPLLKLIEADAQASKALADVRDAVQAIPSFSWIVVDWQP